MDGGELFGALRERRFRLLWLGQATSTLGDGLVPVALAFAVIQTLNGSPTDLGIVLAAQTLPLVVFVLVGGVWADRLPRQMVMLASDLIRCVVQATMAVLLLSGRAQLWELVVLVAIYGTAQAFFQPAATGLVPATISRTTSASRARCIATSPTCGCTCARHRCTKRGTAMSRSRHRTASSAARSPRKAAA